MRHVSAVVLSVLAAVLVPSVQAANEGTAVRAAAPFTMVAEAGQAQTDRFAESYIVRSILLTGMQKVVQLYHRQTPDGRLELRAQDQQAEDMDLLDAYCAAEGLSVNRNDKVTFARNAVTLVGCIATARQSHDEKQAAALSNDSVIISIESPGSIYKDL